MKRRIAVYVLLATLASGGLVHAVKAEGPMVYPFTAGMSKTIRLDSGALLGVFPKTITAASTITWGVSGDATPALPTSYIQIGPLYQLSILGQTTIDPAIVNPMAVAIPAEKGIWQRELWMYDRTAGSWSKLPAGWNASNKQFRATIRTLDAYVTVVENSGIQTGNATWYCKNHCSPKYPALHATSNDFPVGSYVVVTNPVNRVSVKVKIISGWGQPAGRIIDLSWAAYQTLKPTNKGVTAVTVKAAPVPAAAPATPSAPSTASPEVIPTLEVTKVGSSAAPAVPAVSYIVSDQGTGTVLASQNVDQSRSIASLTKLMTAMVFLDTNPDLSRIMTYTSADVTAFAYLRVARGEKARLKDFFASMLVGSANNAATVLARSTGLSTADFIARMNAKAQSWGLTKTHFVDVNGLDPGDVSTAQEYAVVAGHALHDYPEIRTFSLKTSYTFTTTNTKKPHLIKTTNKLLTRKLLAAPLIASGGKTGYIDEAAHTYALRVKTPAGAQILIVILGVDGHYPFAETAALAKWAYQQYQWGS